MWANDPSRRAVWHAVQSTPATRATTAVTEHELASDVAHALAPLTPGTPRERRTIMAEVIVHVAYSMLNFSIRDNQYHTDTVIELKRMLAAYLLAAEQSSAAEEPDLDRRVPVPECSQPEPAAVGSRQFKSTLSSQT